jgi:capsular polysaccharide biosynthesis protein
MNEVKGEKVLFEKGSAIGLPSNIIEDHRRYFANRDLYQKLVIRSSKNAYLNSQGIILKKLKPLYQHLLKFYTLRKYTNLTWFRILFSFYRAPKKKLAGEYLWICEVRHRNYYHWNIDVLIKIIGFRIQLNYIPTLLIGSKSLETTFIREILDYWKIDYKEIDDRFFYKVDKVITPITEKNDRLFSLENLRNFRSHFFTNIKNDSSVFQRIYISRGKAEKRKILNESELIHELKALNFIVVYCEQMTYSEQVRIFSEAKILVGIHGAGLVNQIYMPPGGKILEIRNYNFDSQPLCFFDIAKACNLQYSYFIGMTQEKKGSHWEDITIDVVSLLREINKLLE